MGGLNRIGIKNEDNGIKIISLVCKSAVCKRRKVDPRILSCGTPKLISSREV